MKILKIVGIVVLVAVVVAAIAAPIGPMPGFLIGGSDTKVPASWGNTADIHEIRLQVNDGPIGRTVIIWTVQYESDLFVFGSNDSGWVQAIGAGGPVRLEMEGQRYNLQASPVTEGYLPIIDAWMAKYSPDYPEITQAFPPAEEAIKSATVYRLSARS